MAVDKLPPQNLEAEQAVLGGLLIDPRAILDVADILKPEDFYNESHGLLYRAILALFEKRIPADFVTVCAELGDRLKDVGIGGDKGAAYLTMLINATPTSVHVAHYARIVQRTGFLRGLERVGGKIAGLAYEEAGEVRGTYGKAMDLLIANEPRSDTGPQMLYDILRAEDPIVKEWFEKKGRVWGVPTGLIDIDGALGGLQRKELMIVGARPSVGKTSLVLAMMLGIAKQGLGAMIFSLEMSKEAILRRLVCMEARIDSHVLRRGDVPDDQIDLFWDVWGRLESLPIIIDDTSGIVMPEVRARVARESAKRELGIVAYDFLGLGGDVGDNEEQRRSKTIVASKGIGMDYDVPFVLVQQVGRKVEGRADKKPQLSDLRWTGMAEQAADAVIFIYREDYYHEDEFGYKPNREAEIIIAKNRNGPRGVVNLRFFSEYALFTNATEEEIPF